MTNSEIFKAAHKMAHNTVELVGDYQIAFSLALKEVYSMNSNKKAEFIAMGGKMWTKNDMERVYITADMFNKINGTRLSDSTNKFFFDCKTNALMRSYKGKKPQIEIQY